MEQYLDSSFGITPEPEIVCTEELFVTIEEEECLQHGHVAFSYAFADTETAIRARKHVAELMEQEDSYDLDLWLDAMADVFGVDMVWAPEVRNGRIQFDAVVWA